nr:hypothetical protein [Tanacetum cinerariifolium]
MLNRFKVRGFGSLLEAAQRQTLNMVSGLLAVRFFFLVTLITSSSSKSSSTNGDVLEGGGVLSNVTLSDSSTFLTESSAEQVFWSQYLVQTDEPNLSDTTIVEVPKELPKVSMVNSCLKKLKFHLASFDMVVKERTTTTAITEGT